MTSRLQESASTDGPILVTGAAGKTGLAVLGRLVEGADSTAAVRAFVRTARHRSAVERIGADEIVEGDLLDRAALSRALRGVRAVYHICPNVHPDETEIGHRIIELAALEGVAHFVFHSVLHPQCRAMPHHWAKLLVEERLFESGLDFTVLQPAPYMQNLMGQWTEIVTRGVYRVPYAVSTRVAMVDLEDVADAAARVLCEPGHAGAVYELSAAGLMDQTEIASSLSGRLGLEVAVESVDRSLWARNARSAGWSDYKVETLLAMFRYYERFGMTGNATVLENLLGRPAATFEAFVDRLEPI